MDSPLTADRSNKTLGESMQFLVQKFSCNGLFEMESFPFQNLKRDGRL